MTKQMLQWHPAFFAVIQIELEDEPGLEFLEEYELSKKPMRIDTLIIRKNGEQPIHKKIGRIFRKYNLIEYKSPDDSLSINDFYKVYGYACFLQSDTERVHEIPMTDITITFVCNHYPRKMFQLLEKERGIIPRKVSPGIYYLEPDSIPIQLLISHELPPEENRWLNSLRDDLESTNEIPELLEDYKHHKNSRLYRAAMDLITRANQSKVKEVQSMCDALFELFQETDKYAESMKKATDDGVTQGITQGRSQGITLTKMIFKLSMQGESPASIAEQCGISEKEVQQILE